jgi:hypothetical protein
MGEPRVARSAEDGDDEWDIDEGIGGQSVED